MRRFSEALLAGGMLLGGLGCGSDRPDGGTSDSTDGSTMGASTSTDAAASASAGGASAANSSDSGGAQSSNTSGNDSTGGSASQSGGAPNASGAMGGSAGDASTATSGAGDGGSAGDGGALSEPCLEFGEAEMVGTLENDSLPGPSGIAASRAHPGVLYAHGDAGSDAEFFAFDEAGADLGSYALAGATATDWEDITVGPGPGATFVFLGDIGDNAARTGGTPRSEIQVYRVPEPSVTPEQTPLDESLDDWEILRFTYPDEAHDAETLLVDPVTQDLILVTKEDDGASLVFRAPGSTPPETPTELEAIGSYQFAGSGQALQVSAGDVSPNGDRIILRTYEAIYLWPRADGQNLGATFDSEPITLPSPTQPQGEGLTFSSNGNAWFAAGEQERALYRGDASCP